MASKVVLVIQSKVKEVIRKAKMNCSSDVADGLSALVQSTLEKGIVRAKANGRKTVRASDL